MWYIRGEEKPWQVLLAENEEKREHEDLSIEGMIKLKWILGKTNWTMWTGSVWFRVRIMEASCEPGNEHEVWSPHSGGDEHSSD
jgi:hypothetical protein